MRDPDKKKTISNEVIFNVIGIVGVILLVPIFITFVFWYLDTNVLQQVDENFLNTFVSHSKEILIISVSLYALAFYYVVTFFRTVKPKKTDMLASQCWSTVSEQKKFFGSTVVDASLNLEEGGSPINYLPNENIILYEKGAVHDIVVGTTRCGKSRKIVRQLVMIVSMAGESMIFNDPKKEMYFDFRNFLEKKKDYKVNCLDFRNLQYSDGWNPLDSIIDCLQDRDDPDIDNADQYSQDMVTSIVVDSGKGEQIWIDGQKALIKGIILANCQANVSEDKKNFYSVYQTLALLGGEQAYNNNPNDKKMKLSAYMNSLDETDIARTAYTTITNSPEKTRGSFMTSALATLQLFSSIKLMKVLSKSDFSFREFTEGKRALFIVNPDEKKTYDRIAGICFDQSYQTLVFEANRMQGRRLKKKAHMIYDEFGNMPTIDAMQSKMTVALSRGIVYHLYVQGFDQLNDRYDESIARIIRGNCNLTYFISSADLNTCKEVAESIGDETIWGPSHSANYNPIASSTGSGVNYSMSKRQLVDANELMVADNRDGNGIIVKRTYFSPSKVYLPDCSEYPWYEEMKTDETEISKADRELNWAVPRCFELRETEIRQAVYTDEDCNSISMSERRRPILTQKNSMPNEKELYWYWSMRDDLSESVKKHVIQHIANCNKILSRKEIMKYLKSKEFFDYINPIDVADKQRHSTESADRVKMVKTALQSFDNNSSQKQSTLMKKIDDLSVPQLRELASVARVIRDGKARNG
ncbi:type IV secretory system conjugative DNA transfer family protein [Erysipelatoclostridium ramosum]|uniref:Type IV secretory system conjugative DNA transfer family protein n=1 Tax=Thomasclavelia ramosa TaxID=1547 RepID=A0AB35ILF0_9FIRM|nr:type IV secretory system conjugative DNA transfer family protein [Thomasclavelia ramosa]MDB7085274.1 type IV secretory system conjugative DNA transfer family protein [Thomasclavelia ramosa]